MTMVRGVVVRNVNEALEQLVQRTDWPVWRDISPRGMRTLEHQGPFITEYTNPRERVLFSSARDANPFFHFFESLWILAGRKDLAYLRQFNSQIARYSDNDHDFYAAYGYRLREHFHTDQIIEAVTLLRKDNTTRQVVLSIWDPRMDLGAITVDMPCNCMIMLKVRDGRLNMTVCCRSNDAIWGAYGANAVQFSVLQEFIASAVDVEVGSYVQMSDSFHVYTDNEAWLRLVQASSLERTDHYEMNKVKPYPLVNETKGTPYVWLEQCEEFISLKNIKFLPDEYDSFFVKVAKPLKMAWDHYKNNDVDKNQRIDHAISFIQQDCQATDWALACTEWLERRKEVEVKEVEVSDAP